MGSTVPLPFIPKLPGEAAATLRINTWTSPGGTKKKGKAVSQIFYVTPNGKERIVAKKRGFGPTLFRIHGKWERSKYPKESLMTATIFEAFKPKELVAMGIMFEANESPA